MAVNVSKIAVQVTGETAQLTSAMTQASRSVGTLTASQNQAAAATTKLNGASTNANFAINQLIFAADDAATAFGTQGWAGSIRAASNNLTMLAATSGNLYVFIGTVAVTAVAQLTAKYWDQNEAIKEQIDLLGELNERQSRLGRELRQSQEFRDVDATRKQLAELQDQASGPGGGIIDAIDIGKEQDRVQSELERTAKELEAARLEAQIAEQDFQDARENPPVGLEPGEAAKQIEDLRREADAARKRLANLEAINKSLERQSELLDEMQEKSRDRTLGGAGGTGGSVFTDDMRKQIDDVRRELDEAAAQAERDLADALGRDFGAFSKLPGVMQMGSSAAVSTINQATAGSRNVSDQQRMLQNSDRTVKALERIREIEEKRKEAGAEVVPV